MDYVDEHYDSREERILLTTLAGKETVLERNPFPYRTPAGVQHWTLWCVRDMSTAEIESYVCTWIHQNMPQATAWNFDENESRSIDLFHVHVYLEVPLDCADRKRRVCDDFENREHHDKRLKVE